MTLEEMKALVGTEVVVNHCGKTMRRESGKILHARDHEFPLLFESTSGRYWISEKWVTE